MRSQRRLRLYVVVVVVFLVAFTYFTTDTGGGIQNHRFYKKTVTAMNNAHVATTKKNSEGKDRSHIQRLDLDNNNNNNNGARKTPSSPSALNDKQQEKSIGSSHNKIDTSDEISVAGRTKMSVPKPKEDQVPLSNKKTDSVDTPSVKSEAETHVAPKEHETSKEDEEEKEASAELDFILKRSPIIVFSKSYCPYSRKAKSILSQYRIVPAPYVVELNEHPLGANLQKLLGKVTGRRTVPNVLINGISIGGGDDVEALDKDDKLISKIKSVGGKSIMEIERMRVMEGHEHEI
ncbi:Glutaredoxin domain protein [Talaromyces stipitatus ATCC 10500]|uniref:Glutaredoxin domain protein n=1 Tax=Talaromyces stipitatus (strain ATCC 10500 / CBS 375.48 / QM 6759 / NRRL 1006) TaxID=441959 RepID=B8M742_TALSN|nr:Glutaredoxin domain protein [Talaromyces stipitatus ATCC 10500]EED20262.1 Glutaredoxin domain protein [Talaromyces stipitatus ATCC 10500]